MKPIRVLHVCNLEVSNYYLNNLSDFTKHEDVEYSFLTTAPPCDFVADLEKRGHHTYALDAMPRSRHLKAIRGIWNAIEREKPDIVHPHLFEPTYLSLILSRLKNIKTVATRHHSDLLYKLAGKVKRNFYLTIEQQINNRANHIIAPSQMVRSVLVEQQNVPSEKVSVIPYGQTTERYDRITPEMVAKIRDEFDMENHLSLVFTARLDKLKGHSYLFEAFAPFVRDGLKAVLYLVGSGEREEYEQLTRKYGIAEQVKFLGWRDDALTIMSAADVIVHPSLSEALSNVTIEALMLAKPVVATDVSGARETLGDGKYGKIVAPADADAFRQALLEIVGDLETANKNAKIGREHVLQYMSAKRVADEYTKIYRQAVS